MVEANPVEPIEWGLNAPGMQAKGELPNEMRGYARSLWLSHAKRSIATARELAALNVHKQIVNRVLEPFSYITTLVSATEYHNFFNLRCKDVQPEFRALAFMMLAEYNKSTPVEKSVGDWHLPFADRYLDEGLTIKQKIDICVARAARTSYLNMEGDIDHQKDYDLYEKLNSSNHWSPFEHCARPGKSEVWYGNFKGWMQYRKGFKDEFQTQLPQHLKDYKG